MATYVKFKIVAPNNFITEDKWYKVISRDFDTVTVERDIPENSDVYREPIRVHNSRIIDKKYIDECMGD